MGHGFIHFTRELNKPSAKVEFLRLPAEIKWIDRDAMAAESRTWIKGLEAEGFGRSRCDHFPNVYAHAEAKQFQFVHQRDVHAAINIFQQLGHFRRCRARYADHAVKCNVVESAGSLGRGTAQTPDHFWNVASVDAGIARVLTLRRISHQNTVGDDGIANNPDTAGALDRRRDQLLSRTGISRAFEDYQLARTQMVHDRVHGGGNVTHVRSVVIAERCRHANQNGIDSSDLREIGGRAETLFLGGLDLLRIDTMNVGFTGVEAVHLDCIDIKAGNAKSLLAEQQNQWETHVAKANDPYPQLALLNQR